MFCLNKEKGERRKREKKDHGKEKYTIEKATNQKQREGN